jgi:hypothetical protein
MTHVPHDAPMSARMGARIGPEVLASIIAVPVVIVAILVFLLARGSSGPPDAAIVPPAATATTAPATAGPSAAPPTQTAVATPTTTPDNATARVVLQLVDQAITNRSDLAKSVAARQASAQDIADKLRAVAATLVTLEQPLAELQQAPDTAQLATRIGAVSDATHEAVTETQRASITNTAAYKAGGQKVVDALQPLIAIRAQLVAVVGPAPAP